MSTTQTMEVLRKQVSQLQAAGMSMSTEKQNQLQDKVPMKTTHLPLLASLSSIVFHTKPSPCSN